MEWTQVPNEAPQWYTNGLPAQSIMNRTRSRKGSSPKIIKRTPRPIDNETDPKPQATLREGLFGLEVRLIICAEPHLRPRVRLIICGAWGPFDYLGGQYMLAFNPSRVDENLARAS